MSKLLQFHRRIALTGAKKPIDWFVFLLLFPFALLYGLIGWFRNKLYDWGVFSTFNAEVPVVSVGNLAVGGTGKTPVVDWLVKEFLKQGKKSAVISRGYGGTFSGKVGVVSRGDGLLLDAGESGDEPFLLARRNPETVVLIARKRSDGVRVAVDELGVDIIILDDGFQHRAMQRDLDLVLLDATNPLGNCWPFPAGLLREFPSALNRADLLLLTRSNDGPTFHFADKPIFKSRHQLATSATGLDGKRLSFQQLKNMKLCAFAGIADPQGFFTALTDAGLKLENTLSLNDHCPYDKKVLIQIATAASGCDALVTTEKDAVKLSSESFDIPCYQVPMTLVFHEETAFKELLANKLWRRQCL